MQFYPVLRLSPRSALLILALLLPAACSRHAENSPLHDASFFSGPTSKDSNLTILPLPPATLASRLRLDSRGYPTATYLRTIDNLAELGRLEQSERISSLATRLHGDRKSTRLNSSHT